VAEAALASVRTHEEKREWYENVRAGAREAQATQRDARGAEF
jgi:hypothetical protein